MDAINKDAHMSRSPEEIVSRFVKNHELVDKHLALAYKAGLAMAKEVEEGLKAGMVAGIPAKTFLAAHRAAAGEIAAVAERYANLHELGYAHAQANGITLGRITRVGGVDLPQPEFTTMDGGR